LVLKPADIGEYGEENRDRLISDVRGIIIRNKAELDRQAEAGS